MAANDLDACLHLIRVRASVDDFVVWLFGAVPKFEPGSFRVVDGSGLSRYDLVSAASATKRERLNLCRDEKSTARVSHRSASSRRPSA